MSIFEKWAALFGLRKATDFESPYFPPGTPQQTSVDSAAREDAPMRRLDYPDHINSLLSVQSVRAQRDVSTGISHQTLRNVAENVWQIRLAVEHVKDEMESLGWRVALKKLPDEQEHIFAARAARDKRGEALTARLRKPDGVTEWGSWLRAALEDMLVIDAATIYNWDGALELVDGATIRPLLDEAGRIPRPPLPAFEQWIKGEKYGEWTVDEVIYAARNPRVHKIFGFSPVEQVLSLATLAANRTLMQILRNSDGNLPPALINAPEGWTPKMLFEFQTYFDAAMMNPARRTKITFIPSGSSVQFPGQEFALKEEIDEWISRSVAYAFGISPNIFIKQMNRASSEQYAEESGDRGMAPRKLWVKSVIDRVLRDWWGGGDFEFVWDDDQPLDERSRAEVDEIDIRSGVRTVDEARADRGLPPKQEEPGAEPEPPARTVDDGAEKLLKAGAVMRVITTDKEQIRERHEPALTEELIEFFAMEARRLTAALLGLSRAERLTPSDGFQFEFDWDDLKVPIRGRLAATYLDGYAAGAHDLSWSNFVRPNGQAAKWAAAHAGTLITNVEKSTKLWVRGLIRKSVEEAWSPHELSRRIHEHHAFSKSRAMTIARTELAFAQSNGTLAAWQDSGLVQKKRWLLGREPHVQPDGCNHNAGKVVGIDKAFPSGDMAPPLHPNCKCVITAVVSPLGLIKE